jgi:hypothetical protein
LVLYFERARFEWHPKLPAGQNVMLADLGGIYFIAHEEATSLNSSLPLDNIPLLIKPPLFLQTLAFVARSATLLDDTQKVFVIMQDQTLSPVPGVDVRVTLHLSSSQVLVYPVTTVENGIGWFLWSGFQATFPDAW